MRIEKDFKEFIELLNNNKVKYLIVGGFAFSYYAEPRFTKDIDFFVKVDELNSKNLIKALNEFGFGGIGLKEEDFLKTNNIIQLGYAPLRIDIITSITGVIFTDAWKNKLIGKYGDIVCNYISKKDLIKNKEATARPQDVADVKKLTK